MNDRALFLAAATLSSDYGMPRFNSARIYALKGEADQAIKYLAEIKRLGRAQRDRLNQARKDEAFRKLWDTREFKSLFE